MTTTTTTMPSASSYALSSPPLPSSLNLSPSSSPRSTRSTKRSVGSAVSPTSPTFPTLASSIMNSGPTRSPSVQSNAPPTPRTSPPRTKAARVPVLLEAFPAPPSHIPTAPLNLTPSTLNCPPLTPTSSTSSAIIGSPIGNPPPSRPPSLPLPPVPGPSRISEHDTVLLLSSAGKRSKRNSRYSTMASDGRRDSVMSGESGGRDSYYSSSKGRDSAAIEEVDEFGSLKVKTTTKITRQGGSKSSQSPTQLSASPYLSPVSPKSNAAASMEQLTHVTMSPMPLSDTEDEGHVLPSFSNVVVHPSTPRKGSFQANMESRSLGSGSGRSPALSSSRTPRARAHHTANESISSIDMRDLPADDGTEWGVIKPGRKPILDDDLEYILESHGKSFSTIPSVNVVQASPFKRAAISAPPGPSNDASQHSREFSLADPIDPMASVGSEVPDVMNYSRPLVNKTRSPPVSPSDNLPPFSPFSSAPKRRTPTAPTSSSTPFETSSPTPMSPISPSFNSASSSYPSPAPSALSSPAPAAAPILAPRTTTTTVEEPRTSSPDIDDILAQQPRISKKPSSLFARKGRAVSEARERVLSSSSQLSASSARNRVSSASSRLSGSTSNSTPGNPRLSSTSTSTRFSSGSGNLRLSSASYGSPRLSSASSPRPSYSFHLPSSPPIGPGFGFSPNPGHITTDSESWSRRDVSYAYGGFDDAEDYGDPDDANAEYDLKLEQALEGEGSDGERLDGVDSDSSIDLHTPLPHLMVRHGLLSPNSKLLPGADSRSSTPYATGIDGRPGSTLSLASVAGSLLKDERDTPMRRVRHRDGKLLRGGIGLTTGLGWSDSEDEDAPSPLTRRLSALNLSRRSSASSVLPSAPRTPKHPLSRSFSSGTVLEAPVDGEELHAALREHGEWAQRQRNTSGRMARTTLPPTAWQKHNTPTTSRMSSSSIGSNISSDSNAPPRTKQEHLDSRTPTKPRASEPGKSAPNTLSTPSTRTISSKAKDRSNSVPASKVIPVNKEKSLPPLPNPSPLINTSSSNSRVTFPRARTYSSTSSASSPVIIAETIPDTPPVPLAPIVRPLHLPRLLPRSGSGDRPAVPVPSINSVRSPSLGSFGSNPLLSSPEPPASPNIPSPSVPSTPGTPKLVGIMKPKPRTGTGMVYRNTSASGSKMRAPVPLATSMSTSVSQNMPSSAPSGRITPSSGRKTPSEKKVMGSVPRMMSAGTPKAIAL